MYNNYTIYYNYRKLFSHRNQYQTINYHRRFVCDGQYTYYNKEYHAEMLWPREKY